MLLLVTLLLLWLSLLLLRPGAGLHVGQLLGRPQLQVGPPRLGLGLGWRVLSLLGRLGLGLSLLPLLLPPTLLPPLLLLVPLVPLLVTLLLLWLPLLLLLVPLLLLLLLLRLEAGLQVGQLLGRPQLQVGPSRLGLGMGLGLGRLELPQLRWLGLGLGLLQLPPLLLVPLLLTLVPLLLPLVLFLLL